MNALDCRGQPRARQARAHACVVDETANISPSMSEDPDEIPLFPLPGVVLFPLSSVPLFVFEPRYRQMMTAVLAATPPRIGMIAVQEAYLEEMTGDPPVANVGCEGEVVRAEKGEDGTFRILLQATRRFEVVEEIPRQDDRLYRIARVASRPDHLEPDELGALRRGREAVLGLLWSLVQRTMADHADAFRPERFEAISDAQLVNNLAQAIDLGPHDKQQLLEIDGVLERQRVLVELMRFRLVELEGGSRPGPGTVH